MIEMIPKSATNIFYILNNFKMYHLIKAQQIVLPVIFI